MQYERAKSNGENPALVFNRKVQAIFTRLKIERTSIIPSYWITKNELKMCNYFNYILSICLVTCVWKIFFFFLKKKEILSIDRTLRSFK